jgi:hypothetical protein
MKWVESSVFNNMYKTICYIVCINQPESTSKSASITSTQSHNSVLAFCLDTPTTTVCYASMPVAKTSRSYIRHKGSSGNSTTNTSSDCGVPTRW